MENEIIATGNKYFIITPEQKETINSYMNNKDTVMVARAGFEEPHLSNSSTAV